MKVFFRPAALASSAADAPGRLAWSVQSKNGRVTGIQATNPTPYHVSLTQITATVGGHPVTVKADMVDPFASRSFDLPDQINAASGTVTVEYWFVNDYGGNVNATASASAAP